MRKIYIILFSLAFCLATRAEGVDGGVLRWSLEQCVDSALSRNPALTAAAVDIERARILKGTAFDPPMTGITLKQETTGGAGPENGVMFSQEFDFPTVYTSRHSQLDALYCLEIDRFRIKAEEISREVEGLYHSLLYRQRLLELNSELAEIYEKFLETAKIRYKEGESGMLEVMNAERMLEKSRLERGDIENALAADAANLRRLVYSDRDILPAPGATQYEIAYAPGEEFNFNATLRGGEAMGMVTAADREIALAKNRFLPGITLGATVQALIKSFNPYHVERERFRQGNFMGFEVGISVPLFFGAQNARLKAANAEKAAVALRNDYAEAEAVTEVETLSKRAESLRGRLAHIREVSIPRADEIKRIAEVSYTLGEIDYLEYIANLETAWSVYRDLADTVNEYNQTVIQLKEITAQR